MKLSKFNERHHNCYILDDSFALIEDDDILMRRENGIVTPKMLLTLVEQETKRDQNCDSRIPASIGHRVEQPHARQTKKITIFWKECLKVLLNFNVTEAHTRQVSQPTTQPDRCHKKVSEKVLFTLDDRENTCAPLPAPRTPLVAPLRPARHLLQQYCMHTVEHCGAVAVQCGTLSTTLLHGFC